MTPPNRVEREQLERFIGSQTLDTAITSLVFIFADTTLAELNSHLDFGPADIGSNLREAIRQALSYLYYKKTRYFSPEIMKVLLDSRQCDYFYAHIEPIKGLPLMFEVNPFIREEVTLYRRSKESLISDHQDIICRFDRWTEEPIIDHESSWDPLIAAHRYNIDISIKLNGFIEASAEIVYTTHLSRQSWTYFLLEGKVRVDSVRWDDGVDRDYFKGRDNPFLWLECDSAAMPGDTMRVTVYFHGEALSQYANTEILTVKQSKLWYPKHAVRPKAIFDITYHYPDYYTLVCLGREVSNSKENNTITARWITDQPVKHATFSLGKFKTTEIRDDRIPPVTIFVDNTLHSGRQAKKMGRRIGADLANSLFFFQSIFGNYPVTNFIAVETPYTNVGEAFKGVIQLTYKTFLEEDAWGYNESFRAHEAAHQWWGISVGYDSYHDQWLSEGIATFAGLMYVQHQGGNQVYFDLLEEWKRQILENRKYIFGSGQEAGPIWLGYRTSSSSTEGDYGLIIYKKGAWVLHMLRNMMIDFQTMNEDKFMDMLKEFYANYQNDYATTRNFQTVVEKYTGKDMQWFFDQWIYGTEIPTYRFSYSSEPAGGGRFQVTCHVEQLYVSPDFRMEVPLFVTLVDGRVAKMRITIDAPREDILLPLLPAEPTEVIFNPFESVLCTIVKMKEK
ncbi:MAG: hypothetical protein IH972_04010 [Candidatus Marinimicrobia bacterium]|nr:hypothetical protein [Candidatus Neomarinimicrobiota bacterium]